MISDDFSNRGLRVLLVEDSVVLGQRLLEAIEQDSHVGEVRTVDNESAAVSALHSGHIDVMILDLHLKQGTGFGVMREAAKSAERPSIVVLTNYDLPEYKSAALALGASFFLDKARDYDRLPDVLHQISTGLNGNIQSKRRGTCQ